MPALQIPQEIVTRADVRRALAEHDFADAFRIIKQYAGFSQNRIAIACGLTPGKVSTIMSGSTQVTSYDVLVRIADGLGIPGGYVGLAPRPWEGEVVPPPDTAEVPVHMDSPWQTDVTVELAGQLTSADLAMNRRTLARALAATTVSGAHLLDSLEGWMHPGEGGRRRTRPGRLGLGDVEQLEESAKAFRTWDHRYGGGLRRRAVLGQLSEVAATLEEHQAPVVEERLHRVLAYLAGTAATMAWDSGLQRRAQDYYRLSLRAAHAGGDRLWGANVLAGMARQMLYNGRPHDALELVRLAQEGSRGVAGPRVRAMLRTREAWAMAALGRTTAFERATELARQDLADASADEPYWIGYFDDAELTGTTGGRLLELARQNPRLHAAQAGEQIRAALARRGPEAGRSHVLDRLGLAEAYFLCGDLVSGCAQTHAALDAGEQMHSARVREGMAHLYSYTVGHGASPTVREARSRLREHLAD
ncbi:helix-turn-helix domain-containing protein [Streptomyces sp. NBC_00669]|uniref:helix-turn-helix domain-containing protein n=1 Tax=Streptomyces sp. NBC_00669 TaxID=2976011 RepID=UPI002E33C076|nr:helix-turn-helix domain-containing protein [Streptomyces sp. NBC_00669]